MLVGNGKKGQYDEILLRLKLLFLTLIPVLLNCLLLFFIHLKLQLQNNFQLQMKKSSDCYEKYVHLKFQN